MIYNRFNREISCHYVTVSLHHRITVSLCQSVICLAPCHQTSQSFALPPATKPVSHLPCPLPPHPASPRHRISQSFALPPATKPVSHLPCPLPPNQSVICLAPYHHVTASLCHRITVLVSHLPCPLPPSQSVICLAPCHQASQSFALPPATKPVSHLPCPLPPRHRVRQSFALPPATKPVSHLPCPLPPNQSVICLAPYHHVTTSLHHRITASPCHRVSQSFALPPATKPVNHLPCPLPPNQSVICLAPYHRVTVSPC